MKKTDEMRFLEKTDRLSSACWLWTAAVEKNGYARFYFRGRQRWAHRVAYQLFVGEIEEGKEIDHLCKNTRCVNPMHLEAVTHQENMARAKDHGGAALHRSKTHCPSGHEYTKENTHVYKGMRYCRACGKKYKSAYKKRIKEQSK